MKYLGFFISLIITFSLVWVLNHKFGTTPPMGKLFNPFFGFWQNAENTDVDIDIEKGISALNEDVKIVFDDNMVPHIFAYNDRDVYFAQGYVTAKLRLWQMEFQTLYAAGRLSEVVGEVALDLDKFQRKIGMVWSAEHTLSYIEHDERMIKILNAYTDGINYYLQHMGKKKLPLEYKILDYKPEKWTNLKTVLLLNYMAWDLSGYNTDLRMTNILNEYGIETVNELFNSPTPGMDPIIPPGTPWNFDDTLDIPEIPANAYDKIYGSPVKGNVSMEEPDPSNGSNNWAIAGSKSKTGLPILSNDPHLSLTLPSIWMQIQLTTPDMNVYGVSLQGAPGVIIGFNKNIAWGMTNVDPDIMDWYQIRFKDENMDEYFHEGRWKQTNKRHEVIKIRGEKDYFEDVVYTHHGPVVFRPDEEAIRKEMPVGCAMRWLAHEPSNVIKTFYQLNRAENYEDYVHALHYFYCPAQNFVYADKENTIAIWPNGRYPLKWEGQGQFVLDGTKQSHEWQGWIPQEQNPHIKNPERGFVSSANQDVTDSLYPYYLNWEFTTFERGARVNDLLEKLENADANNLREIQNDNFNLQAEIAVPVFLEYLEKLPEAGSLEKQAISMLKNWDYKMDPESIAASVYDALWEAFDQALWKDDFGSEPIMLMPDNTRTLEILMDSVERKWVDDHSTPEKEDRMKLISRSFKGAIGTLEKKHGDDIKTWQWAVVKGTSIRHLGRVPGLGTDELWIGGGHNMVNATKKHHGPSWRMVVELGEKPNAFGIYPGGQSGNPGSPFYANMVEDWASGELRPLYFLESADELGDKEIGEINFKSEK